METSVKILTKNLEQYLEAYDSGTPLISDEEYDRLILNLKAIDPTNHFLKKIGTIDGDYEHKTPMLSLDKIHNFEDLESWLKGVKYLCSLKLDGVAVSIHYKLIDGRYHLHRAVTRGNGRVGKIITSVIQNLDNIPTSFESDKFDQPYLEIRGECIINKIDFKILKQSNPEFVTARNLVAGSLNTIHDPLILKRRNVKFIAYNIIADGIYDNITDDRRRLIKFNKNLKKLASCGFKVVPSKLYNNYDDIEAFIESIENTRDEIPYDIDGIVIQMNNVYRFLSNGFTDHHPRGAVAFKFKPDATEAVVINVTWQVGRTGVLTPVAELEPVVLNGVTISRATLHNYEYVVNMRLKQGDTVKLQRSGDVIPKITENLTKNDKVSELIIPKECPVCKSEVIRVISEASGQANLYCSNKSCPEVLVHRIINWIRVLDIKGIGYQLIQKLIKRGYIKDIPDLYKLSTRRLMFIDKIKEKSASNIWKAIHENKRITLAQMLGGLGIAGIGLTTAEKICDHFNYDYDKFINCDYTTLCNIDGIGEVLSYNIKNDLDRYKKTIGELMETVDLYNPNDKTSTKTKDGITGKKFCLSGSFNEGKKYYFDLIENFGGIIKSSVVKDLDILVSNETATSKYKKAKEIGIKILTENDLVKLIFG